MKLLLLLPLLLGVIPLVKADSICTLTSEIEPDVTITLKYTGSGGGIGTLNYKNKPSLGFDVGIWNGYGGQYYIARSYSPELIQELHWSICTCLILSIIGGLNIFVYDHSPHFR